MPSFRSLFRALIRPADNAERLPSNPPATTGTDLWRRTPLQTWPLGSELTAVRTTHSETVRLLPNIAAEWISTCTEWATLETHLRQFHDQHGGTAEELHLLEETLPKILSTELLISISTLLDWCKATPSVSEQSSRPLITAIGFPTGGVDGLQLLPRTIRSFAENLREHDRTASLVACDSSLHPALREQYREQVRSLSHELGTPVRYIGAEEKQRFAHELARLGACSPEVAEFALSDPLRTGFAPGANRNMMLLDQAGTMFCSVDHDVICKATRPPESSSKSLSFYSECDPFARWTFANRTDADRTIRWEFPDHLGLHESMLGRGTSELITVEALPNTFDFNKATDFIIQRLGSGPTRIRATFCGHSGEPGVPGATYYLAYRGNNRARLTASEEHYQSSLSSRCLLALSATPAIGDASLSPGVAFGIDHRELLPPFFPVLHAEDFSWSALVWQCCPGSVLGLLPWAVAHEPIPGKPFLQISDLETLPPFVIWEWAHILRFWTLTWQPPATANTAERIRSFARMLTELSALSPADFTEELRRVALLTTSHQIAFYESQLHSDSDELPDFWRKDIESYLAHMERSIATTGFELPLDLHQRTHSLTEARSLAQQLTARYAAVLNAWPDMVTAATEIKNR